MNDYHERTREVCRKWQIPYIDLFYESGLNRFISEQYNLAWKDGTHLKDTGYDMISPKIEA